MPSVFGSSEGSVLRLVTYLTPSYPLEVYQLYQHYLEEVLGCTACLMVESRWSAPPKNTRPDPFTNNHVDIAFMCSSAYSRYSEENNTDVELLAAAPVHVCDGNVDQLPIYFSRIIVHSNKPVDKYKELIDLKGHKFAFNDESSVSGSLAILRRIRKELGQDSTFFGDILQSGSHNNSIEMVLNNRVDCAAIDSIVLDQYMKLNPERSSQIRVLFSIGPLPSPPVLINSRISTAMKIDITQALLTMNKSKKWTEKLLELGVTGFAEVDATHFDKELELNEVVRKKNIKMTGQTYY